MYQPTSQLVPTACQLACMRFSLNEAPWGQLMVFISSCMSADCRSLMPCVGLSADNLVSMNQKSMYGWWQWYVNGIGIGGFNGVSTCINLPAVCPPTKCHVLDNRSHQPVHQVCTAHQPVRAVHQLCAPTVHQVCATKWRSRILQFHRQVQTHRRPSRG